MAMIAAESLLEPVSESSPTGDNLEYQPEFAELERASQGKPARQMGSAIVPGEPPNYARVVQLATELLGRSKDLRIVVLLVRAASETSGFEGLDVGLAVVRGLLERFWEKLYPELDPDDGDATMRMAALSALSAPEQVAATRAAPLLKSPRFGPISLRDIAIASGELAQPRSNPELDSDVIAGSFRDAELSVLTELRERLQSARSHIRAIQAVLAASAGTPPDFAPLDRVLYQAGVFVQPFIEQRAESAAAVAAADVPAPGGAAGPSASLSEPRLLSEPSRNQSPSAIRGRDDVVHWLDRICEYYAQHEPSSPLPLLLQRCRRLVASSFLDIVRDMAPDALSQVQLITGKTEE
jgi:type VI secretion system protein ImpA